VPRYRFHWSNLPRTLLDRLREDLNFTDDSAGDPAGSLCDWYGARPKEDFIHDAWPTLLEAWLGHDGQSRQYVVDDLREVRGEEGTLTKHRDQMTYLHELRNAKNPRAVVLDEFIAFGESYHTADNGAGHAPAEQPIDKQPEPRQKQLETPPKVVETPQPQPPPAVDTKRTPFTAAPGSVVLVRDAEWLVTHVEQATDGFFVHVIGLSELVRDTVATFSTALDTVVEVDPTQVRVTADDSPGFRKSRLWLEATLRKTPVAITDPALTIAHRGLAAHLDYQFKAVQQALDPNKLRPRILLADAVGLGKTIEIGMILAELARRGRGERILIVTPKHVLEQMQMELWTRFALPFVRLDSTGIQRIRQLLPATRNPFTYYKRAIISIDTLKSDRYLAHLRKQRWDAVVVDESHNVTNTASQNNRLARLLAEHTDALILASATPHNGRAESFAELVRMLDPSAVSPVGELDYAQVKKLVIRRHRNHTDVAAEVGADWAKREPPCNVTIATSPAENAIAEELETVWLWPDSGASPYSGKTTALFPWVLAKAYLSSPLALAETVQERLRRLGDDAPAATERQALHRLAELTDAAVQSGSAKYDALLTYLDDIGVSPNGQRRVVIFAERVATLTWLAESLRRDRKFTDDQATVLHGGLSDTDQQAVVDSFKLESSAIRVLVTGDIASEGVNLHSHCHHLVHYDIPWSLIRIEQRNGRIDRYGQRHRPQVTTFCSPRRRSGSAATSKCSPG
jgi:ERCC4-related helicase